MKKKKSGSSVGSDPEKARRSSEASFSTRLVIPPRRRPSASIVFFGVQGEPLHVYCREAITTACVWTCPPPHTPEELKGLGIRLLTSLHTDSHSPIIPDNAGPPDGLIDEGWVGWGGGVNRKRKNKRRRKKKANKAHMRGGGRINLVRISMPDRKRVLVRGDEYRLCLKNN